MSKLFYYEHPSGSGTTRYWRAPRQVDVTISGWSSYANCVTCAPDSQSYRYSVGNINRTYRCTRITPGAGFGCVDYQNLNGAVSYQRFNDTTCTSLLDTQIPAVNLVFTQNKYDGTLLATPVWQVFVRNGSTLTLFESEGPAADDKEEDGRNLACVGTFTNLVTVGGACYGSFAAGGSGGTATIALVC